MQKTWLDGTALAGMFVALATAAALAAEQAPQWQPLFTGKNLDGWTIRCRPADKDRNFWKGDDGAILADSMGAKGHNYVWLTTDKEYSDFVLRLKFQAYRDSPGNSGVQIRSRYDEAAGWLDGPQIDINPPEPWRTGMMWDETRGVQRWIDPNLPKGQWVNAAMAPKDLRFKFADEGDGWNDLVITAKGNHVGATLNGVTVTDLKGDGILDDAPHREHNVGQKGVIALQIHTGDQLKIRFKDLAIRELSN